MSGGPASSHPDVLVVGGGVIGLAVAERLAGAGASVRLLEAEATGAGASGAAAGMLAPISEAQEDSPGLRLGLESLAGFEPLAERLREETGIDIELEWSGLLHAAFGPDELESLERRCQRLTSGRPEGSTSTPPDLALERLDGEALREAAPGLDASVAGGLFSPREGHVRPPLLVQALEASARARGARIDPGIRVDRLRIAGGRVLGVECGSTRLDAGAVVLCAGARTPSLLEASAAGLRGQATVPAIEPVRGQILSLGPPLPACRRIVWAGGLYLVPKRDGSWVVGATEERVGFERRVTAGGVAWLLERASRVFPALVEASFGSAWAGLRPVSRDGLPWIGAWPEHEGLYVAAGHGRNGVLLAPATASLIASAVIGPPREDAEAKAVRPESRRAPTGPA